MTNNKNKTLLPFATGGLIALCDEIHLIYDMKPGGAEMLLIELLAQALVRADPAALSSYLQALSTELPKGDEFEVELMARVRNELSEAVATDI